MNLLTLHDTPAGHYLSDTTQLHSTPLRSGSICQSILIKINHSCYLTSTMFYAHTQTGSWLKRNFLLKSFNFCVLFVFEQFQPSSFMGEPTLRPHQPFNPNDDATKLYKAMKGFGTGEFVCYNLAHSSETSES